MSNKILIVTGEHDSTADLMVLHLADRGVAFERFHPQDLPRDATVTVRFGPNHPPEGRMTTLGTPIDWSEIAAVWYRRPQAFSLSTGLGAEEREFAFHECTAVTQGMWRSFDAFWVNHPDRIRIAESKPLQLTLAGRLGFRLPRTLFTNDPGEVRALWDACGGAIVYKSMTQGVLGQSVQKSVYTNRVTAEHLARADLLRNAPGLFQEEIPKAADLRITVVGERLFPIEIRSQTDPDALVDWRRGAVPNMAHVPCTLPAEVERACLALNRRLGLHYSAIDMVLTPDGEHVFLEINPSGQFGWIESVTGLPIIETLADLLLDGARRGLVDRPICDPPPARAASEVEREKATS
ncbi:MAG: ATP-dependent carboxylate-amine ligase [Phyllobacteriaceae bacterium]|nr:ATP-dependent carboxylate-amine ligase [Phyllobacteriaceae bacterium]